MSTRRMGPTGLSSTRVAASSSEEYTARLRFHTYMFVLSLYLHHVIIVVVRVLLVEVRFPLDGNLGLLLHLRAHLRETHASHVTEEKKQR